MNLVTINQRAINKALNDIALDIRKQIRANCDKEIDMDGVGFKKYSQAYVIDKARYQSRGKNLNLARAEKVNLKRTGLMLRSISVTKKGDQYEIYISDKSRAIVAYKHHTGSGVPERKFFGVSDADARRFYNNRMNKSILVKK